MAHVHTLAKRASKAGRRQVNPTASFSTYGTEPGDPYSSRLRRMSSPGKVFQAALTLPEDQRADLAHQLIASLEGPADDPTVVAAEWSAETTRRLAGIEAQTTTGIPWDQLREQLKS